jgi:citrate lyase subunit beta/citryl-CoA lyase
MVSGPVTSSAHVETTWELGADAIMLDLEDTVPPAHKERARSLVRDAVGHAGRGGGDVLVRVNGAWELAEADLEASVWEGVAALIVPKVENAEALCRLDEKIAALESERGISPGTVRLAVTIESVAGLFAVGELVHATPRVVSLTLGAEDFTRDLDVQPTASGDETLLAQLQLVLAARSASISPLYGVLGTLRTLHDLEAVRGVARWASRVGFRGAACSAHSHVAIANEEFAPLPDEVKRSRELIEAYSESTARGDGRIDVRGEIVDTPVVIRAERLLARAAQIEAFEERKRRAQEHAAR